METPGTFQPSLPWRAGGQRTVIFGCLSFLLVGFSSFLCSPPQILALRYLSSGLTRGAGVSRLGKLGCSPQRNVSGQEGWCRKATPKGAQGSGHSSSLALLTPIHLCQCGWTQLISTPPSPSPPLRAHCRESQALWILVARADGGHRGKPQTGQFSPTSLDPLLMGADAAW